MSFVLQCVTNIEKHSLGNEFSASSAYNDIKLASLISVDAFVSTLKFIALTIDSAHVLLINVAFLRQLSKYCFIIGSSNV